MREVFGGEVATVQILDNTESTTLADYGDNEVRFNVGLLGWDWFDASNFADQLSLVAHKFGHHNHVEWGHTEKWANHALDIAGELGCVEREALTTASCTNIRSPRPTGRGPLRCTGYDNCRRESGEGFEVFLGGAVGAELVEGGADNGELDGFELLLQHLVEVVDRGDSGGDVRMEVLT